LLPCKRHCLEYPPLVVHRQLAKLACGDVGGTSDQKMGSVHW
jgi:hypothetical protein